MRPCASVWPTSSRRTASSYTNRFARSAGAVRAASRIAVGAGANGVQLLPFTGRVTTKNNATARQSAPNGVPARSLEAWPRFSLFLRGSLRGLRIRKRICRLAHKACRMRSGALWNPSAPCALCPASIIEKSPFPPLWPITASASRLASRPATRIPIVTVSRQMAGSCCCTAEGSTRNGTAGGDAYALRSCPSNPAKTTVLHHPCIGRICASIWAMWCRTASAAR